MTNHLPDALRRDIDAAGYYPALVGDVVETAVADETVRHHLVHLETTFDAEHLHRHVTVLVLTDHKLVIAHADDHVDDAPTRHHGRNAVTATSETIALAFVRGVMLTHVVANPEQYVPGTLGREITLTIGWGTISRIDLLPATCGDPSCDADHGYDGTITNDDISLRISAEAEGESLLRQATSFAAALSSVIGSPTR